MFICDSTFFFFFYILVKMMSSLMFITKINSFLCTIKLILYFFFPSLKTLVNVCSMYEVLILSCVTLVYLGLFVFFSLSCYRQELPY